MFSVFIKQKNVFDIMLLGPMLEREVSLCLSNQMGLMVFNIFKKMSLSNVVEN